MEVLNSSNDLPPASSFDIARTGPEDMDISSNHAEERQDGPESFTSSSEEEDSSQSETIDHFAKRGEAALEFAMETDERPLEEELMQTMDEDPVETAVQETREELSPPTASPEASDETRFDLEFVENHMRHLGSNAGPYFATSTPIILGRELFKRHDKHRVRGLISRTHCRIESSLNKKGDVEYYVKDTSINGTFVGPNRISPSGPGALIQHGDVIGLLTSHSGPIETYSAEGTYFKVTLGLRFLRPNLPEAKELAHTQMEEHAPIASPIGAIYKPGTFAGLPPSVTITVPHEAGSEHHRGSLIIISDDSSSTTTTRASTPSIPSVSGKLSGTHTPRLMGEISRTSTSKKKISKHKSLSSTNHSGNDTDDTDGDDERDIVHPTPNRARKAVVTVSRPTFDFEATPSAPAPGARKSSTVTKQKLSTGICATPASPNKSKVAKKARSVSSTPSRSSTSTPEPESQHIAPGTYWSVSNESSRRKRSRSMKNGESGDELASEEPARKLWAS